MEISPTDTAAPAAEAASTAPNLSDMFDTLSSGRPWKLVTDFCITIGSIANTNATESLDSGISELSLQDQGNETMTEATCLPSTISPDEVTTIDDAQTTCEQDSSEPIQAEECTDSKCWQSVYAQNASAPYVPLDHQPADSFN